MAAPMTKEQYIQQILELLQECNDVDLLDLIYRIVCNSVAVD